MMGGVLVAVALIAQLYDTSTLMVSASSIADQYHLNKAHFLATLKCESGFVYNAKGDDGTSIGIAQISLAAHPEISYREAMDPDWSLLWMAQEWMDGNAAMWSCWRELYT